MLKKLLITTLLAFTLTNVSHAAVTVDVSGVPESQANAAIKLLGYLGVQPTGTIKQDDDIWCAFNDWKARDNRASSLGHNGRFSLATTFGGKWYCFNKKK